MLPTTFAAVCNYNSQQHLYLQRVRLQLRLLYAYPYLHISNPCTLKQVFPFSAPVSTSYSIYFPLTIFIHVSWYLHFFGSCSYIVSSPLDIKTSKNGNLPRWLGIYQGNREQLTCYVLYFNLKSSIIYLHILSSHHQLKLRTYQYHAVRDCSFSFLLILFMCFAWHFFKNWLTIIYSL